MTDLLFQTGVYLRKPGGNVENVNEQKAAGIKWALLNVGAEIDGDLNVWDRQRMLYRQAGIPHGPWKHVRSMKDLESLISVAVSWKSEIVGPNIEDVVGDNISLKEVGAYLRGAWLAPVHMATLPWVQNEQGWQYVDFCYLALELFPLENPLYVKEWQACIDHAFAEGAKRVTLLYSTTSSRSTYPAAVAHCLYTADNVTNWNEWKDTVPQIPPKPPEAPDMPEQWYEKPYITGAAVGPAKLPRPLKAPSNQDGKVTSGDDAMAYKRAISRAGRLKPWSPSTWNNSYGETFAMGKGTGNVGDTGVRGFQRQMFPDDKTLHTGNLGDQTYQALRRARVSDPESVHYREPVLDAEAIRLLKKAQEELSQDDIYEKFRAAVADFCVRAEGASTAAWTYTQARPYTGIGVPPELNHDNDCSSYVVLAYFWGRKQSGLAVADPSGYQYDGYGNTWDNLDGHPTVTSGNYLVGDLAHYRGHVTICKKAGDHSSSRWSSFGSEPRPKEVTLYYRGDLAKVVRPPLPELV